jgi:hypothetical protein
MCISGETGGCGRYSEDCGRRSTPRVEDPLPPILIASGLRSFATGLTGVLLGLYLAELGLGAAALGLVTGAGLAGRVRRPHRFQEGRQDGVQGGERPERHVVVAAHERGQVAQHLLGATVAELGHPTADEGPGGPHRLHDEQPVVELVQVQRAGGVLELDVYAKGAHLVAHGTSGAPTHGTRMLRAVSIPCPTLVADTGFAAELPRFAG